MPVSAQDNKVCSYAVDAHDRLVSVDEAWARFAIENGGRGLLPDEVLQSCLWDHVQGMENRILYKRILDHVRSTGRSFAFEFRCDAPDRERLLRMTVSSKADGVCQFQTQAVRMTHRAPLHWLARHVRRSSLQFPLCGWCMRTEVAGRWHDLVEASEWLGGHRDHAPPQVAHTICPDCFSRLDKQLTHPDIFSAKDVLAPTHPFRD